MFKFLFYLAMLIFCIFTVLSFASDEFREMLYKKINDALKKKDEPALGKKR